MIDPMQVTEAVDDMAPTADRPPHPDDLLSTREAAEVMGVTDAHVRRLIGERGELPAQRIGARSWAIRRADAEAWAAVQRRRGPKPRNEDRASWATLVLTHGDVRQWHDLGRGHPIIPAHAINLAIQLLDRGVTGGPFEAGPLCDVEITDDQVRFRVKPPTRRGPIDF